MAREAARRTQCEQNLKQIGNAIADYAQAKQFLPASRTTKIIGSNTVVLNWPYPILPQLEQTANHRLIRMGQPLPPTRIKTLECPSQTTFYFPVTESDSDYPISYAVNGGRANATLPSAPNPTPNHDWEANGVFVDKGVGPPARTQKYPEYRMEEISKYDGNMNTLLVAETVNLQSWLLAPLQQHSQVLWFPDDPQSGAFIGLNQDRKASPNQVDDPLNDNSYEPFYARPSSDHPNGFNILMADNSVHFMQDTVDYRIYAVLLTSNGRKAADPALDIPGQPTMPNPLWQHPPGDPGPPPIPYPGTEFD
jgi:hypothetical protein